MKLVSSMSVFLLTASLAVAADAKLAREGDAKVEFIALGPGGMKIVGTTTDIGVDDNGPELKIRVPLANLVTGIALRDKHMKEKYLQVQTFPEATLSVPRASISLPASGDGSGIVQGTMTLHGQTHPASVQYTARKAGDQWQVSGKTHVNMRDYGIDVPSYLGVTVKPDVDVDVHFNAIDR